MNVKSIRLILKVCAEDTRLRILHLLIHDEMTVKDICQALDIAQSVASKHLSRLRLLKVATDRRQGNLVFYSLIKQKDSLQYDIINFLKPRFKQIPSLQEDLKTAIKIRKK